MQTIEVAGVDLPEVCWACNEAISTTTIPHHHSEQRSAATVNARMDHKRDLPVVADSVCPHGPLLTPSVTPRTQHRELVGHLAPGDVPEQRFLA